MNYSGRRRGPWSVPVGGGGFFAGGGQLLEVGASWLLENLQVEERHHGEQVVEDIGLDVFVFDPGRIGSEYIYLERYALRPRLQLADQEGHLLVDVGVVTEVGFGIGAKGAQVGQAAAVDELVGVKVVLAVVFIDLLQLLLDILGDEIVFLVAFYRLLVEKFNRRYIDIDSAFYPAATAMGHTSPVLEGLIEKLVSGNDSVGLVPVLDLDGVQSDLHHVSVGPILGHLDPVADADEILGGYLDRGHQRQDGVLEDEQQYGHHGTQTTQQQAGRFASPDGDNDDEPHDVQQDPDQVKIVVQGQPLDELHAVEDLVKRRQESAGRKEQDQGYGHQGQSSDLALVGVEDLGENKNQDRRNGEGESCEDPVLDQHIVNLSL